MRKYGQREQTRCETNLVLVYPAYKENEMKRTIIIFLALCALMARPAQAQDGEFELEEGYYISDGMLTILIKEGNDELVECLRWAANQDKVEIGGCTQITGLTTIYGEPIAESWDRNAAFTGLTHIGTFMLFEHTPELRRYFKLFFPSFPDRLTPYRLFTFYASLPYVEYVGFVEAVRIPPEERPSAISETTWGFIKHRGFSRNAFRSKD